MALLCLAAALLLRAPMFGNPVIHVDEQFYLQVGDMLLHGRLPYVDVWDRKPIALFLLFALLRAGGGLFGGDGVLAYQIGATLAAAATAFVAWRLARMVAGPVAAGLVPVAYLAYLDIFNCVGGQAPVFYNLPVALAGWITCQAATRPCDPALGRRGAAVMALTGLAVQIKYTVLFEGAGLGCVLLARAYNDGADERHMARLAALWVSVALLPTALALGTFAALGHGAEFVQANFVSIFERQPPFLPSLGRLAKLLLALLPLWLAIHAALRSPALRRGGTAPDAWPALVAWGAASLAGFFVFGTWYDHYTAAMLVPLTVLAAPALGLAGATRWRSGFLLAVVLIAAPVTVLLNRAHHGTRAEALHLAGLVSAHPNNRTLYLYEGDPALYALSGMRPLTRFVFPAHLHSTVEQRALGVDPVAETRRIMAARPAVVVIGTVPQGSPPFLATRAVVLRALAEGYRLSGEASVGTKTYRVYAR